jgi:hypothetical protein
MLFLGAIDSIMLLELGVIGMAFTLVCLALIAWKGPRLAATAGLVTGLGVIGTILFAMVAARCAVENATPGSGCDAGDIWTWIAVAVGVLALGVAGTVQAARRLRAR